MKNRLKIFHVRDEFCPERQMTVATEVCPDGEKLTMGISFCNPKDNFSKKVGRTKAIGRLRSYSGYHCKFTGHSADDFAKYFNDERNFITKPQKWKHGKLVNVPFRGLTFTKLTGTGTPKTKVEAVEAVEAV
jgi:hypothetical protein